MFCFNLDFSKSWPTLKILTIALCSGSVLSSVVNLTYINCNFVRKIKYVLFLMSSERFQIVSIPANNNTTNRTAQSGSSTNDTHCRCMTHWGYSLCSIHSWGHSSQSTIKMTTLRLGNDKLYISNQSPQRIFQMYPGLVIICYWTIFLGKRKTFAVADPGFHWGRAWTLRGVWTHKFAKFSEKLHEIKTVWMLRGGVHPHAPLDPPMIWS